jgi:hypothetical protein
LLLFVFERGVLVEELLKAGLYFVFLVEGVGALFAGRDGVGVFVAEVVGTAARGLGGCGGGLGVGCAYGGGIPVEIGRCTQGGLGLLPCWGC